MDDGRETYVQFGIFLIFICNSFEHYLLNIHQSILHIISEILDSLFKEGRSVSPLEVDTVLMFKHDEFVAEILADVANKSRVEK